MLALKKILRSDESAIEGEKSSEISANESQRNVNNQDNISEDYKEGGYGWVVVFACFLVTFSSWGQVAAYGIYLSYYIDNDVFSGAGRSDFAIIGGLGFGAGISLAPFQNIIEGVIGTKMIICTGAVLQFVGCFLASYSTKLWQLYLTQGVLQSLGACCSSMASMTVASQWFKKRRTLANSLSSTGTGLGGIFFNLVSQRIIDAKNYRWALRCSAIVSIFLLFIAAMLIRTKKASHQIEFTLYDKAVMKCFAFWLITLFLVITTFGYVIVLFSLANFTISLGYTAKQGSVVGTMNQLGMVIGRPLAGLLSDRYGAVTVASLFYYLSGVICLAMWLPARNYATTIAFSILEGIFAGVMWPTISSITVRVVGISKLNVSICSFWVFVGVSGIFSEWIGLSLTSDNIRDPKAYSNTTIFAGVCFLVGAVICTLLRGYIIARDELDDETSKNQLHISVPLRKIISSWHKWPARVA